MDFSRFLVSFILAQFDSEGRALGALLSHYNQVMPDDQTIPAIKEPYNARFHSELISTFFQSPTFLSLATLRDLFLYTVDKGNLLSGSKILTMVLEGIFPEVVKKIVKDPDFDPTETISNSVLLKFTFWLYTNLDRSKKAQQESFVMFVNMISGDIPAEPSDMYRTILDVLLLDSPQDNPQV